MCRTINNPDYINNINLCVKDSNLYLKPICYKINDNKNLFLIIKHIQNQWMLNFFTKLYLQLVNVHFILNLLKLHIIKEFTISLSNCLVSMTVIRIQF